MRKESQVVNLPIGVLRIANAEGQVELVKTVPCPTHKSISLERCRHCGLLESIRRDKDGGEIGVSCHVGVAAPEPEEHRRWRWRWRTERDEPVDPTRTPVSALMTRNVTCITCGFSLEAVAAVFLDTHIGAVPVVDGEGRPIGILSKTDLLRETFGGRRMAAHVEPDVAELTAQDRSPVGQLMSPLVQTVREDDSVTHAAELMLDQRHHHLPVVDTSGHVVGMLSTFDLARLIVHARHG